MKLTFEISEPIAERLNAIITQSGPMSANALIQRAILNELERVERGTQESKGLANLTSQVQELRNGQRALIALVDCAATVIVNLLRGLRRRE